MIITMYKGCILNEEYKETFGTNEILEKYLATLSDNIVFNVDMIYQTSTGSFTLYFKEGAYNIFCYNYMKMYDSENNFTVYAFIDSVKMGNECATIYYTADIWNTFMPSCNIRDSVLCNERLIRDKTQPYYLPIEYETNDTFNITSLSNHNLMNIVVQLQYYDLASSGEISKREVRTYLIAYHNTVLNTYCVNFNSKVCTDNLIDILTLQGTKAFTPMGTDNLMYFEITKIYTIPEDFGIEKYYYIDRSKTYLKPASLKDTNFEFQSIDIVYQSNLEEMKNYELNFDFKNLLIGTLNSQLKMEQNGSTTNLKIYGSFNDFDIRLFMGYKGVLQDITNDFMLEIPFTSINGETMALRAIKDNMETAKGAIGITSGLLNTGIGIANTLSTGNIGGLSQAIYGVSQFGNGIVDILGANKDKYQTNYGIKSNATSLSCAYSGIVVFSIIPDNEKIINITIDEVGYVYSLKVNKVSETANSIDKYNTVKFSSVKIYGNAPQDTLMKLKGILTNGVKIWYSENV